MIYENKKKQKIKNNWLKLYIKIDKRDKISEANQLLEIVDLTLPRYLFCLFFSWVACIYFIIVVIYKINSENKEYKRL